VSFVLALFLIFLFIFFLVLFVFLLGVADFTLLIHVLWLMTNAEGLRILLPSFKLHL